MRRINRRRCESRVTIVRLIKSYKTSHAAFRLLTTALLTVSAVALIGIQRSDAQSCPTGNPCSATRAVAFRGVALQKLHVWLRDGSGTARVHNRREIHQPATIWASFGILRAAFVKTIRPLKSSARVSRPFGTSQIAPAEAVRQLECVAGEQTGVIISRLVAGQTWACLAGAFAIVAPRSRINAISMMVITIRIIASAPAVVVAVARQFSSMFPADSK